MGSDFYTGGPGKGPIEVEISKVGNESQPCCPSKNKCSKKKKHQSALRSGSIEANEFHPKHTVIYLYVITSTPQCRPQIWIGSLNF